MLRKHKLAAPECKVGLAGVHAVRGAWLSQAACQALHEARHVVLVRQQQAALKQGLAAAAAGGRRGRQC
jgi:hypothetical protein